MSTEWGMTLAARLADLAAAIGYVPIAGWGEIAINDITEDSRTVIPGALFVAVPGTVQDGADFLEEAVDRGAAAVVSQADRETRVPHLRVEDARAALSALAATFHSRPTEALFTVGVTGTNGKTTVCRWIAHLLGDDRTTVIGTVANEARGLRAVTTPSSPIVQRIAADARESGCESLVIEASSIGLMQRRLEAVDFDTAVFTNLTHDHLDLHRTMGAYLDAKRVLFRNLKAEAYAVVNADDRASEGVLVDCRAEMVRYGFSANAELRVTDPTYAARETRCTLAWQGETALLRLPHPGTYNLANALAAAEVALLRGDTIDAVVERLGDAPAVDGRLQFYSRDDGLLAVVDFAHTPDSLKRALEVVRMPEGRRIVVFGCAGGADPAKRPAMGAIAGRLADWAIVTTDNPKHESPTAICGQIEAGLRRAGGRWERVLDRAKAVARAVDLARPGDVVLVAGKGHERYQIVGDAFVPYSDREELERLGFVDDARSADGSGARDSATY